MPSIQKTHRKQEKYKADKLRKHLTPDFIALSPSYLVSSSINKPNQSYADITANILSLTEQISVAYLNALT